MKRTASFALFILLLFTLSLSGCSKYKERNIVGKTASQIEEQYGQFDLVGVNFVTLDSSYNGYGNGYLLKESRVGFLGTNPAEYLFIIFDENSIATACYIGWHCNGG